MDHKVEPVLSLVPPGRFAVALLQTLLRLCGFADHEDVSFLQQRHAMSHERSISATFAPVSSTGILCSSSCLVYATFTPRLLVQGVRAGDTADTLYRYLISIAQQHPFSPQSTLFTHSCMKYCCMVVILRFLLRHRGGEGDEVIQS